MLATAQQLVYLWLSVTPDQPWVQNIFPKIVRAIGRHIFDALHAAYSAGTVPSQRVGQLLEYLLLAAGPSAENREALGLVCLRRLGELVSEAMHTTTSASSLEASSLLLTLGQIRDVTRIKLVREALRLKMNMD